MTEPLTFQYLTTFWVLADRDKRFPTAVMNEQWCLGYATNDRAVIFALLSGDEAMQSSMPQKVAICFCSPSLPDENLWKRYGMDVVDEAMAAEHLFVVNEG